jgi:putative hydrolase of the HAD superfamily
MADLKNKKHLFFDFDDTLWDFQKNSAVVLEELFLEFDLASKLNADFPEFLKHYRSINLGLWSQYYKRQINKEQMRNHRFNIVFNKFGYDNYDENLRITSRYLERTPRGTCLKEGCIDILGYLQKKYQLHIITNGFKEIQGIKLDGAGLRPFFGHIIISEEHDLVKPEEKIFRLAEELAAARPEECVMIGDSYESDIEGGIKAGWDTVYFAEHNFPGYRGAYISSLGGLKDIF